MVRRIVAKKPNKKPKPSKVTPVYIWGADQDEAEQAFIHAYAGGIAYDTETTGLTSTDEVTEIALVQICTGIKLFESRVRPHKAKVSQKAEEITGITDAMLKKAPYWEEIEEELLLIIGDAMLVAWSGEIPGEWPFDSRLCGQSHEIAGLGKPDQFFFHTSNIKRHHWALRQQQYGDLRVPKKGLANAMRVEGLEFQGREHGALTDALAVAAVVRAVNIKDKEQNNGQEREATAEV